MSCKLEQVPWLYCPAWVPPVVAAQAERMYDAAMAGPTAFEKIDALRRLATDPRMKLVWDELERRRRSASYEKTDSRLYAAHLSMADFSELLRLFFREIIHLRWQGVSTIRRSEVLEKKEHYLEIALQLRADFDELGIYRIFDEPMLLLAAARFYERIVEASAEALDDPIVISKQKISPLVRGFSTAVAQAARDSFGSHLYRTVATIANVAFPGADVTAEQIREWSGVKAKKKAP